MGFVGCERLSHPQRDRVVARGAIRSVRPPDRERPTGDADTRAWSDNDNDAAGGPTGRVTERREVCSVTSVSGHTCTVEATNAAGSHAESGSATGTNAGPSLSISPGSGVGRTGFTATVNWSDSDGDSVSIAADTGGRSVGRRRGAWGVSSRSQRARRSGRTRHSN